MPTLTHKTNEWLFYRDAARRLVLMTLGLMAIPLMLLSCSILLIACTAVEGFLHRFPALYEKYSAKDYV